MDRLERRHHPHVEKRLEQNREAVDQRAAAALGHHPRAGRVIELVGRVVREQSQERIGLAASGAAQLRPAGSGSSASEGSQPVVPNP